MEHVAEHAVEAVVADVREAEIVMADESPEDDINVTDVGLLVQMVEDVKVVVLALAQVIAQDVEELVQVLVKELVKVIVVVNV